MTKKKALKMIMSYGIQRNEAERMLAIRHNRGKTNKAALEEIDQFSIPVFFQKIKMAMRDYAAGRLEGVNKCENPDN